MLDPRSCKLLLIYGGSFDPPHRGHVELPLAARCAVGADGVLYVPARQPPHKPGQPLSPGAYRLAMLRLALGERDDAAISTWELDRDRPSYTVETLEHLRGWLGPGVRLRLLIGADMAATFDTWRSPERIIELAQPLVMMREGVDASKLGPEWAARIVHVPRVDISSRELRALIAADDWDSPTLRNHLNPAVLEYVKEKDLYRRSNNPKSGNSPST